MTDNMNNPEDIITRLRKRAEIRRQIPSRKSVQEGKPDRLSDLLEEAADLLETINNFCDSSNQDLLLLGGEMTSDELRTVKAFLDNIGRRIIQSKN